MFSNDEGRGLKVSVPLSEEDLPARATPASRTTNIENKCSTGLTLPLAKEYNKERQGIDM
jgi:hypothetical protein